MQNAGNPIFPGRQIRLTSTSKPITPCWALSDFLAPTPCATSSSASAKATSKSSDGHFGNGCSHSPGRCRRMASVSIWTAPSSNAEETKREPSAATTCRVPDATATIPCLPSLPKPRSSCTLGGAVATPAAPRSSANQASSAQPRCERRGSSEARYWGSGAARPCSTSPKAGGRLDKAQTSDGQHFTMAWSNFAEVAARVTRRRAGRRRTRGKRLRRLAQNHPSSVFGLNALERL